MAHPMKSLVLLISSLFLCLLPQENPKIEIRYDRFADASSVTLTELMLAPGVVDLGSGSVYVPPGTVQQHFHFHIIGVVTGPDPKLAIPTVTIAFTSNSTDWVYLKLTNTLRFSLNDSERLELGILIRTASDVLRSGRVAEQIALTVPFATAVKLSKASKLEMQVSRDEFVFTKEQLADMRDWVNHFSMSAHK